jgi:hypothetical protein
MGIRRVRRQGRGQAGLPVLHNLRVRRDVRCGALFGASAAALATTPALTAATATAAPEAAAFAGRTVNATFGGWALRRGVGCGRGALGAFGTLRPVRSWRTFGPFATRRTRRAVRSLRTLGPRRTLTLGRPFDIRLRLLRRAALGGYRTAGAAASAASSATL